MNKLKTDQSSSLGIPPWHPPVEIEDGSELKIGDSPMAYPLNVKNHQASKLGDAQGIPSSSSTTIRSSPLKLHFYHFTYYVIFLEHHFILLSVCLLVMYFVGSLLSCVEERHAPLFH